MHRFVVPFKRWHYDWLVQAGSPAEGKTIRVDDYTLTTLEEANSWTGVVDGEVIACAGTMQQWKGRHFAWAYLSKDAGPHLLWITRQVREKIKDVEGRIEFTVRKDFADGHKWARLLGFKVETPLLEKFGPYGEDHVGYVRIQ